MIETWEEQVDFMRAIPDSAVKILWILFISGRSLTNKELRYACDKSDKTIQAGLEWLEPRGFIQNNGKFNGWSLAATAFQQLPLPFAHLGTGHQNTLPAPHGAATPQNGDGESFVPEETRRISVFLSSSSSYLSEEKDQEEEEETPQTRRISVFLDDDGQTAVRQMLIDAGIGPRSRKLAEIMALGLDVDFVAAHVHVWQRRGNEPPGYLITRLESGEAPPACNCPDCRVASQIPAEYAEYADIILR